MAETIYLVRHGQSNWNVEKRIQGSTDQESFLTDDGHEQSIAMGKYFLDKGVEEMYAGRLRRVRQTAQHIQDVLEVPLELTGTLNERDMGYAQGKLTKDLEWGERHYLSNEGELVLVLPDGTIVDPLKGSESIIQMRTRAGKALQKLRFSDKKVVMGVGSGWILSHILNVANNEPAKRYDFPNASYAVLTFENGQPNFEINQIPGVSSGSSMISM